MSSPAAREGLPVNLQYIEIAVENIQRAQYLFEEVAHPNYSIEQRIHIDNKVCILEARVQNLAQRLKSSVPNPIGHIQEIQLISQDPRILGFTRITEENLNVGILQHLHEAEVKIRNVEMNLASGKPLEVPGFETSELLAKMLSCIAHMKAAVRGKEIMNPRGSRSVDCLTTRRLGSRIREKENLMSL